MVLFSLLWVIIKTYSENTSIERRSQALIQKKDEIRFYLLTKF